MTTSVSPASPETASIWPGAEASRALALLRDIYQRRRSGILTAKTGLSVRLSFANGALYLPADYLPARRLAALLGESPEPEPDEETEHGIGGRRLPRKAQPEVRALLEHLADALRRRRGDELSFDAQESPSVDAQGGEQAVGPLPTACLVMRLAVAGDEDEAQLRQRFDGTAWLQAQVEASELDAAFWLDTSTGFLLSRLETPSALPAVLRGSGLAPLDALARLCRLLAVGWVRLVEAPAGASRRRSVSGDMPTQRAPEGEKASARKPSSVPLPQLLLERFGRELEKKALGLSKDEHRKRLQELLKSAPRLDHYRLLEVPLSANDVQVRSAFDALARLVHPSHAARLGMPEQASALVRLFEQATEAYRVLSSPPRRREYNRQPGLVRQDDELTAQERDRLLAEQHVERARSMITAENYHQAHELLNEAVRRHPQAATYALLGEVQMRNPNWLRRAGESLEEALRRDPQGKEIQLAEVHLDLGEVYAGMRRSQDAVRHYKAVLALHPEHAEAKVALERLSSA